MVNLVYCPTDLLCFDISLSYYFINLNLSLICSLFSGDIYLSLGISVLLKTTSKKFLCFWRFCNFASIFIANQMTSCFCCFLNWSFWSSLKCICCRLFSMIKKFLALFTAKVFTYCLTHILRIFANTFNKR